MNILILAAGETFHEADNEYPIWLSEIDGQIMLERQITALSRLRPSRFVVCARAADNRTHHIEGILKLIAENAVLVEIKRPTAGAACSALLAIGEISAEEELIIVSATDQHNVDFVKVVENFRNSGADGGILTFESLHPRYSYVRLDSDDCAVEVAEKRPISRKANAGFYWLRNAGEFFDALKTMIAKDAHVNGKFYVSPALNELILQQKIIRAFALPKDAYIPVKSLRHLAHYESLAEDGVA